MYEIQVTGEKELFQKLAAIANAEQQIARSAVSAGTDTLATACRNAVQGTIKREIGRFIRTNGQVVWGRAGLMRYPKRGQSKGPHGIYLEWGTKYITARRSIGNALSSSRAAAVIAMERAVKRKIEFLVNAP